MVFEAVVEEEIVAFFDVRLMPDLVRSKFLKRVMRVPRVNCGRKDDVHDEIIGLAGLEVMGRKRLQTEVYVSVVY